MPTPVPTTTVRGYNAIISTAKLLCKYVRLYGNIFRTFLDPLELAAFNVLVQACEDFEATLPTKDAGE